ncbi:MAG: hypothetical protein WAP23_03445, partial [Candidatus Spechtbacterales bacterium]
TILNVPPVSWQVSKFEWPSVSGSTVIDLDSLRYGGVVLFAESTLDGQENRSETILNDIKDFNQGTFIGKDLSAIKILGRCNLEIFGIDAGFSSPTRRGILEGPLHLIEGKNPIFKNDDISSIYFDVTTECLGHSVTAYSGPDYHRGQVKAFVVSDDDLNGNKLLMHRQCPYLGETVGEAADLSGLAAHCETWGAAKNHGHNADNNIESIGFAHQTTEAIGEFSITACKHPTNETNRGIDCKSIKQSTDLVGEFAHLKNEVSAIVFGGNGKNRQAGVVLYEKENFEGNSEIFIASDNNLEKNFISPNQVSSVQIIGKYKVTFYEKHRKDNGGGKTLVFDNTGLGAPPTVGPSSNGIVQVKTLSNFPLDSNNSWDNQISAIQIEVPEDIYTKQKLGATICEKEFPGSPLCVL